MQDNLFGFELSPQQKLLFELYGPEHSLLTAGLSVKGVGPLEADRLKRAIEALVRRHEILRTSYQRTSGMKFPVQVISETPCIRWEQIDPLRPNQAASSNVESVSCGGGAADTREHPPFHACLTRTAENEHVLTIEIPAPSADRQTLQNCFTELTQLYADEAISEEPFQYADYSQWRRDQLTGDQPDETAGRQFWNQFDLTSAPQLTLPFSKKTDGTLSAHTPQQFEIELEDAVWQGLCELGVNLETVLIAAWQVILWRLTHVSRFPLGLVTSGRYQDDLRTAFGLFSQTLPYVANLSPDQSFSQLVNTVRNETSKLEQFADYFDPQTARNPLCVGFCFESAASERNAAGVTFSVLNEHAARPQFDLELRCTLYNGRPRPKVFYNSARFWSDAGERIARALRTLLRAAARQPETAIGRLPILDPEEHRRITIELNRTQVPFSMGKCVHHLIERRAAASPNDEAVRYGETVLTFTELNQRANRLAHFLRRKQVGVNAPVGLCTERSLEMVIGILGILKAGGCYVPLIPDQPTQRLLHQLSATKAGLVLTQEKFLPVFETTTVEPVRLDAAASAFEEEPKDNPESGATSDDLAYIIFTSGSTGTPKGVAVRHSSLVNYSEFIVRRVSTPGDSAALSFATVSTIGADLGNTSIFPALISGGCLHVISYETAMSSSMLSDYLDRHRFDVLKITPSHLNALLNQSGRKTFWPARYLFLGGEALTWNLLERIRETASCAVVNHYGPTEATVGCCTFDASEDVSSWTPATVPIGRPIANAEIYILDDANHPVPIGVPGEICIGGAGLARGYYNDAGQTEAKFVSCSINQDKTVTLYRTGDSGRFLPDSNIEFLGRLDHQVKISGFRVETGEIEIALEKHTAIQRVLVLPYDDGDAKRLAAYIVAEKALQPADLRQFLSASLPDYMIPSEFVQLARIPLNANGKPDTEALSKARAETSHQVTRQVEPRTPEEAKLAAIWSEVLKKPCVDVHANFFMLGGHSLLAAQIVSRICDAFKVQFPLYSFLQTPTIAELAPKIPECPPLEQDDHLEHFLATLENLSEEEAERLLAEFDRERT